MRALSIRQPYAELILRGIKRIEYRTRPTRIIGERFYIYASKKRAVGSGQRAGREQGKIWSRDLARLDLDDGEAPLPWMIELANAIKLFPHELPTGVIVGTAVIEKCEEVGSRQYAVGSGEKRDRSPLATDNSQLATLYQWHLADIERVKKFRKPTGHPQPVWFKPFSA
jgi:hypothetical protein